MKFPFPRRRSRQAKTGADRSDEHLPGLDRRRADELRRELREGFAGHGYRAEIFGATLVLRREDPAAAEPEDTGVDVSPEENSIVLSLGELARGIAADSDPRAVAAWTDSFIRATLAVDTAAHLGTSGIYRALRLVLMPAQPGGPGDHEGAAYPEQEEEIRVIRDATVAHFTTDLVTCLVLDAGVAVTPTRVAELEEVDDLDTLVRAARRNLSEELKHLDVDVVYQSLDEEEGGGGVWVVRGNSFYLSSAPLLLPEFLAEHLPELDPEDGVLFAVPLPNFLLLREVTEGEDLAEGLHLMASGALSLSASSDVEVAVSPRVHLWWEGMVETVSEPAGEDGFLIQPNSYLMRRLEGR